MNNVLVVYKKSTFELYGSSPDENTRQYVQKNYDSLKTSHDSQKKTLEFVVNDLNNRGIKNEVFYRAHLGELSGELKKLEGYDLVISIGGDGTLLELSHYINETPVLGVNSDIGGSFGYFSIANSENFGYIMDNIYNIK
ncbi:MAG: NAD(+)/NADH kinase, partial [Nanoarchaeota archaeon]